MTDSTQPKGQKNVKGRPGDERREREALKGRFEPDPEPDIEAIPAPEGPTQVIQTDYEIGQHNIEGKKPFPFDVHNPVFMISAVTSSNPCSCRCATG